MQELEQINNAVEQLKKEVWYLSKTNLQKDGVELTTIKNQVQHLQNTSILVSDDIISNSNAKPKQGEIFFVAPTNGILYIRVAGANDGTLGLHLQSSSGMDLAYNTQVLFQQSDIYNATFIMKAGQKIYCYENSAGYVWGGYNFIKSIN